MTIPFITLIGLSIIIWWFYAKAKMKRAKRAKNAKVELIPVQNYTIKDSQIRYINFTHLDFNPVEKQIIYIETEYNEVVNNYIKTNYNEFVQLCKNRNFDFFYLPTVQAQFRTTEFISYHFPQLPHIEPKTLEAINYSFENMLASSDNTDPLCGFLRFIEKQNDVYTFSYYEIDEADLLQQFESYLKTIRIPFQLYSLVKIENDENFADIKFSRESGYLIEEVRRKIEKLKLSGFGEALLKSLLFDKPEISNMRITSDYNILLTDYNNLEVKLHPLPKAVYFLFLKHPEGILFKHLTEYREELKTIYRKITNSTNSSKIEDSINDLTDPTKNAINEKCSRVKEAFSSVLSPEISENYIIKGERGEVKLIFAAKNHTTFDTDI